MSELGHYRLRPYLNLREAAYLAVGVSPAGQARHADGDVVLRALIEAVRRTYALLTTYDGRSLSPEDECVMLRPSGLDNDDPEQPFLVLDRAWVKRCEQRFEEDPDSVLFRQSQIGRWFRENGNGFTPKFEFVGESRAQVAVSASETLSSRERTTLLNIIGALMELVLSPRPGRNSQSAVIAELVENYRDKPGIKRSTLEQKLAEAKRSLLSD